ncbi:hypothetical protein BT93_D0512 [Corymbia citriodora subsp. variegata]|nr:hypothetical protein BT93_D0512 [Corymbia citriodora subsp. variegata]
MKKLVAKVDVHDERHRSKAMRVVSGFEGIGSLSMDLKDGKLTVSGDFDPIEVVKKLRKSWRTEIVSVGPAKEDDGKKKEDPAKASQTSYSRPITYYYVAHEEPPGCVIC